MEYNNIYIGEFIERPNRFIAKVRLNDEICVVHVKNTGRCKELLVPGTKVYLEKSDNPNRKTKYDLVSVCKGDRIINIDSQLPNDLVEEFLREEKLFADISLIKREKVYGASRFDFYIETKNRKIFMEVKGCTLEENGVVSFPDAPTQRGLKHINELMNAICHGYEAYVMFVVQMKDVLYFTPAKNIHKEFADTLKIASERGVKVLAYDCYVDSKNVKICNQVEVRL